jgi:tetratricopeptide (TPR) repeat protein
MEFSEQLLGAVEPVADLPAALAALQRDELVVARPGEPEDRTFVMRHPLVHEVAYRSLLSTRRRTLHRRIGEWLERERGEEAVAEIASHFRDGDDPERAREYLPRAAERAAQLNAQREALDWYRAAADLFVDDPGRRAQMLERAATHSYLLGEMDGSISLVSEAQRLYEEAGDRLHALDCRRWLGRYYWFDGRGHEAEREVSAAIEGLEQLPPSPQLALAYSYRSQLRMLMPDFPVGEQLARRAIAVAEQVGSTEALVHALNNLGMCRVGQGDPGGVADVQRSLALALEHNLTDDAARAYTNLSGQGSAINLFDVGDAEARYEEMLAFDRRVAPGGAYEQWHEAGRAELWASVGRWDEAERKLAELTRIHGANRYVQLDIAAFHALLAAYRGRFEESVTRLRDQDEVAVEIGDMQAYVPLFVALAQAQRGVGEEAAAIAALERVIELRGDRPENNLTAWYLFEAADVCAWLTREPASPAAVTDAVARLDAFAASVAALMAGRGTDPELLVRRALYGAAAAHLRHLRGGTGSPDPAGEMRRWADDLDAAQRIFDAARVRLWTAEQGGDGVLARRAAETFEQLRATPYLVRARRLAQPG